MTDLYDILLAATNRLDLLGHENLSDRLDSVLRRLAAKGTLGMEDDGSVQQEGAEEPEGLSEQDHRLRKLRDRLPPEHQFDSPVMEGEYYEAVDEFLRQEDELKLEEDLQKTLAKPGDELSNSEKIMVENGITPLFVGTVDDTESRSSMEDTLGQSNIGSGFYGVVNRGIYNNEEVAVKVTKTDPFNNEAKVWKEILEIKDNLSEETQRHLPKIYKIVDKDHRGIQAIVMELLEPVDPHVQRKVWMASETKNYDARDIRDFLKDPNWMHEVFLKASEHANTTYDRITEDMKDIISKLFMSANFTNVIEPLESGDVEINRRALESQIYKAVHKDKFFEILEKHPKYGKSFREALKPTYQDFIESFAYNAAREIYAHAVADFPRDGNKWQDDVADRMFSEMPEVKSFVEALDDLKEWGIVWHDLHGGNVMMRPGTKELVIIDVGQYGIVGDYDD